MRDCFHLRGFHFMTMSCMLGSHSNNKVKNVQYVVNTSLISLVYQEMQISFTFLTSPIVSQYGKMSGKDRKFGSAELSPLSVTSASILCQKVRSTTRLQYVGMSHILPDILSYLLLSVSEKCSNFSKKIISVTLVKLNAIIQQGTKLNAF